MIKKIKGTTDAVQAMRLLRTKLFVPRKSADLVERPNLIDRLNHGLRTRLTVVSAPAGFGKSTLLSTWIHQSKIPFAWVSLDERDNDPLRFWGYFLAALQTLEPQIGSEALPMLQSPQHPPFETILTELLNEIAMEIDEFAFVLDDYHEIHSPEIHQSVTFLVENIPQQMHLIIAGRSTPSIPISLWRSRRELVEIQASDLRFNNSETEAFLNQVMGLNLESQDISKIESITEGWVAGLQLAALSMQGEGDLTEIIQSFTGSHRFVFDYLAQEVLNKQPEPIREFLLRTSLFERFCASMCDEILGGSPQSTSQDILDYLEGSNLFIIPLDHQRQWYRYHHLFGDFLRTRLEQEHPSEQIADIHRKASLWYEKHNLPSESLNHAFAARDYERALLLLGKVSTEFFARGQLREIIPWLNLLPRDLLRKYPPVNMLNAWILLSTGQLDQVEACLNDIEEDLGYSAEEEKDTQAVPVGVRSLLGELLCVRANLAFHRMEPQRVIVLSQKAMAYMDADRADGYLETDRSMRSVVAFNLSLAYEFSGETAKAIDAFELSLAFCIEEKNRYIKSNSISHLGGLQVLRGRLHQAVQLYQQETNEYERGTLIPSPLTGLAYTGLANIHYEWDSLELAEENYQRGSELGKLWGNWETLLPSHLGMARVKAAQGDQKGAFRCLEELSGMAPHYQAAWSLPILSAYRALLQARGGQIEAATEWACSSDLLSSSDIPYTRQTEAIILAQVLTSAGKFEEAIRLSTQLIEKAEANERWGHVIEILITQSIALYSAGDIDKSMQALERALSLAEPEGFRRIFLDGGVSTKNLLDHYRTRKDSRARSAKPGKATPNLKYVDQLLSGFPTTEPIKTRTSSRISPAGSYSTAGEQIVEPLSEREKEVLSLVAKGMTNQEIANSLYLSLNTVKTHVKNILASLGVRNRAEAIMRARELKILP